MFAILNSVDVEALVAAGIVAFSAVRADRPWETDEYKDTYETSAMRICVVS